MTKEARIEREKQLLLRARLRRTQEKLGRTIADLEIHGPGLRLEAAIVDAMSELLEAEKLNNEIQYERQA